MNNKYFSRNFKATLVTAVLVGGLLGIFDASALNTSGQITPEVPW